MTRRAIISALMAVVLACLSSCTLVSDDVVARVGYKKLYKSQVQKFIPRGLCAEDSLVLARQYINSWAGELILSDMADKQLSKQEKDVSAEVENYRSSLLKFRYEQHYIQERLDTVVSPEEIQAFFEANENIFILAAPIVKARMVCIPSTSPLKEEIVKLLSSEDEDDLVLLDSLSYSANGRFNSYDGKWIDIVALSREFGLDYGTLLSSMRKSYIDIVDDQGMESIAFVSDMIGSAQIPPIEYCTDKIRESIINKRKYALSTTLERELLEDALRSGTFEIIETDE